MKKITLIMLMLISCTSFALTGLKIGEKNPLASVKSIDGKEINLNGKQTSILVFYRGSWCPYCVNQLKNIKSYLQPKLGEDINLIALSVDQKKVAMKMKRNFSFTFDIVSDPKAMTLKAFNIVNRVDDSLVKKYKNSYGIDIEADSGETHHMIAHPGVFIIRDGKILFADVHENYKERTDNKDILKALE